MNKKHDHTALLGEVKSEMPKDELLSDLADLFKVFVLRKAKGGSGLRYFTLCSSPKCAFVRSPSFLI